MHEPQTIFSVIDAADDRGLYQFAASDRHEPWLPEEMSRREKIRGLVESHFDNLPMLTLGLDRVKKRIVDVGACSPTTTVDKDGVWLVELNLARLMLLPGENPKLELRQMRELYEVMLPFFSADPTRRVDVQLVNERDRHGAVQGRLSCRVAAEGDRLMVETPDSAACTEQLRSLIDASPALQHFLKQAALQLQRMGPWSWVSISEDALFGRQCGPHWEHHYEQVRARLRERSSA